MDRGTISFWALVCIIVTVVLIATMCGCAATLPLQKPSCRSKHLVAVDAFDSDEFEQIVVEASNWWNEQLGEDVFLYVGRQPEFNGIVYVSKATVEQMSKWEVNTGGTFFPHYNQNHCIYGAKILIRDRGQLSRDQLLVVVAHELGHALGLPDLNWGDSVMAGSLGTLSIWKELEILNGEN